MKNKYKIRSETMVNIGIDVEKMRIQDTERR